MPRRLSLRFLVLAATTLALPVPASGLNVEPGATFGFGAAGVGFPF
ncbi:MAG: hypothetical protein HY821_18290 [Acidobacteria bacterium]|nr:hypothetical protein [Acidobacteriota bacterium]